ncbi:hypothetical protein AB9F26_09310 [Falsihalocynthiibacter sp. BN13B15]|uniref:hypothetical protein n=1 Tax=Falsihalocynthiibacter sp. BN13B15 TaxID=3240871 RepID=UPI00350F43E3
MSHIDKIIAQIPSMDVNARARLQRNAENAIQKSPESPDARRVLNALDAFEADRPAAERFDITGLLAWEKYQRGAPTIVRAFFRDQTVGRIIKRANHSGTEKDVYSVNILGEMLSGDWHHISDARAAGEAAFAKRRKDEEARSVMPSKLG